MSGTVESGERTTSVGHWRMFERLKRFWKPNPSRIEPQFDGAVRQRLEAAGQALSAAVADAAVPLLIPPKPQLVGFCGTVSFVLTVSAEGQVKAVTMDGAPFSQVAELETWAYAWTFEPALLNGQAHACRMTFEVQWSKP